jgi:very-short-patch-repair endonuclease
LEGRSPNVPVALLGCAIGLVDCSTTLAGYGILCRPLNPPILGDFLSGGLGVDGFGVALGMLKQDDLDDLEMKPHSEQPDRIRSTTSSIVQAARSLRQNLTPAEEHLWEALRNKQLMGLRFRCQHPVGRFILDFYCPAGKLAIEVDGSIHDLQQAQDEARSREIESHGYEVLRFRNEEVLGNLTQVLTTIETVARSRLAE